MGKPLTYNHEGHNLHLLHSLSHRPLTRARMGQNIVQEREQEGEDVGPPLERRVKNARRQVKEITFVLSLFLLHSGSIGLEHKKEEAPSTLKRNESLDR